MAKRIDKPAVIQSAGNLPKRIGEFVGVMSSGTAGASVARMTSPPGWLEPGQTPEFDEYTLILRGSLRVETRQGVLDVEAGQAVIAKLCIERLAPTSFFEDVANKGSNHIEIKVTVTDPRLAAVAEPIPLACGTTIDSENGEVTRG